MLPAGLSKRLYAMMRLTSTLTVVVRLPSRHEEDLRHISNELFFRNPFGDFLRQWNDAFEVGSDFGKKIHSGRGVQGVPSENGLKGDSGFPGGACAASCERRGGDGPEASYTSG